MRGLTKRQSAFVLSASLSLGVLLVSYQNCARVKVTEADTLAAAAPGDQSQPSGTSDNGGPGNQGGPVPSQPPGSIVKCTPTTKQICDVANGTGEQTCDSSGEWGGCQLLACQTEYYRSGDSCVPRVCTPNGPAADCLLPNGQGTKICNADGSGWGTCIPAQCNPGYSIQSNTCVFTGCLPNQTSQCTYMVGTVAAGVGSATCKQDQSGFGTCLATACVNGYYLSNQTCVPTVCTPNSPASCSDFLHGIGSKTCNSIGSGYGPCQLTGCTTGYHINGGVCVEDGCLGHPDGNSPTTLYPNGYTYNKYSCDECLQTGQRVGCATTNWICNNNAWSYTQSNYSEKTCP